MARALGRDKPDLTRKAAQGPCLYSFPFNDMQRRSRNLLRCYKLVYTCISVFLRKGTIDLRIQIQL